MSLRLDDAKEPDGVRVPLLALSFVIISFSICATERRLADPELMLAATCRQEPDAALATGRLADPELL